MTLCLKVQARYIPYPVRSIVSLVVCILTSIIASRLENEIFSMKQQFSTRFEDTFSSPLDTEELVQFSKAITSNLLGGIGYFYGDSYVDRGYLPEWDREDDALFDNSKHPDPQKTKPMELFTATPSRSFFPRGFYW